MRYAISLLRQTIRAQNFYPKYPEHHVQSLLVHPHIVCVNAFWFSEDSDDPEMAHYLSLLLTPVLPATLASLTLPIPLSHVLSYSRQLLDALAYMHHPTRLIAHRDLKLPNVLVDVSDHGGAGEFRDGGKVVLCDFGSARRLEPGESNSHMYGHRNARART
jgi:serine/threonine protein kinase